MATIRLKYLLTVCEIFDLLFKASKNLNNFNFKTLFKIKILKNIEKRPIKDIEGVNCVKKREHTSTETKRGST